MTLERKNRIKRGGASFICMMMILLVLLSLSYTFLYTHHDCTGADCDICRHLAHAYSVIRQMGAAAWILLACLPFAILLASHGMGASVCVPICQSPVFLKVKLNN